MLKASVNIFLTQGLTNINKDHFNRSLSFYTFAASNFNIYG